MPRMNILNSAEQAMFSRPPIFNSAERKRVFDFPLPLLKTALHLQKPISRICFLLACGYFKATKQFFRPQDYHARDIEYVMRQFDLPLEEYSPEDYVSRSRRRHEKLILDFYGYRRFDQKDENFVVEEISEMVRSQLKPRLIFWRCIDLVVRNRIQTPNYYQLSELILTALNQRKKELATIIEQELTPDARDLLGRLFIQENEGRYARYKLTLLKKLSQSTRPTQIKERAADLVYLAELHESLKPVLPVLDLGYEGIRYFANSVVKSDIFQLNQRDGEDRYVHVVAFIVNQYYRLQDNLVDTLLSTTKSFQNSAQRDYRDWCYTEHKERNQSFKSIIVSLDENIFGLLNHIRKITQDNESNDSDKLTRICKLLEAHNDSIPQVEQQWDSLKQSAASEAGESRYYDILEKRSVRLQNRVSPIIKALGFAKCQPTCRIFLKLSLCRHKSG